MSTGWLHLNRTVKRIIVFSCYLDTKIVLKEDSSNEFETLMLFTESGITLKCQFNGLDQVTVPVDGSVGNFR